MTHEERQRLAMYLAHRLNTALESSQDKIITGKMVLAALDNSGIDLKPVRS